MMRLVAAAAPLPVIKRATCLPLTFARKYITMWAYSRSGRDDPIKEKSVLDNTLASSWRQPREAHGFPDPLLDLIAARFRLLGEPLRLKLLAAVSTGERNVGELATLTGGNQPNVSKHLAALAQGGLLNRRKAGTTIYYSLADPSVLALCDTVCAGVRQRYAAEARALGLAPAPAEDSPDRLGAPARAESHLARRAT
jgi:DNA-binding transcriptional ArsR family regulator